MIKARIGDDHIVAQVNAKIFRPIQVPLPSGHRTRRLIGANDGSKLAILIEHAQRIAAPFQDIDVPFGIHCSSAWIYQRTVDRD